MRLATRPFWIRLACAIALLCATAQTRAQMSASSDIPHLEQRNGMTKLIVDGNPFICVAGELANSSSSDVETMKATFPRLAKCNLNTVLSVVSWDLIEPQEGKFDFWMVDYQIEAAKASDLRLIFLWMASWKNGMSHYEPAWVKADQTRFPRVMNKDGNTLEVLSTLGDATRDADAAAFAAVMRHIREVDTTHRVIAIQLENEVGVLGSTRDFSPAANAAYNGPVPRQLTDYLQQHKDTLRPEMKKIWDAAGDKTSGTWEEVFGKNVQNPEKPIAANTVQRPVRPADMELYNHTDEIFQAWEYAQYMGYVGAQGKKELALPIYANNWLVQPSDRGPGDYPSGGPQPLVHDIWRAGAPAIDILAPDIYLTPFDGIMKDFARNGNPAWTPETHADANNFWTAYTQLNALCCSVMGIDEARNSVPDGPFARTDGFINSISGAIAEAQGPNLADNIKLITLQAGQNPGKVEMGNYVFDFTPPAGRGGGGAAGRAGRGPRAGRGAGGATPPQDAATPAAPSASSALLLPFLNNPFVLIIHTAPDVYYFATNGNYPFIVSPKAPSDNTAAPATIDRGFFKDGKWVLSHRLNGDDIMGRGYDISGAADNHQAGTQVPLSATGRGAAAATPGQPVAPAVFRVLFYQYH